MQAVIDFLVSIIRFCYDIFLNYGLAIILFTLISKIVLFPISVWVQKNSIKMVRIQPEINEVKTKYFGDKDTIAEKQSELMKREKYNAFANVIPMLIQIALLIAMIAAIKQGMETPGLNLSFLGMQLNDIPAQKGGWLLAVPIVAGITSYALCVVQDSCNVLQENSSKVLRIGTMVFSVGISLYLGFFVQVGVAVYWMASNIFSIIIAYLLNWMINPRKYVDYNRLEESRRELSKLENLSSSKVISKEDKKREKKDYKQFFAVDNKKLVFYSESNGFYKYFQGIIEYLLEHTNLIIHYVTSDPKDSIFQLAEKKPQIHPYYIGDRKLITLMMKMDADMVVMAMTDLDNMYIKRSYVRKDVEYVFVPHAIHGINLFMRKGCVDNFDTILMAGKHMKDEIRAAEKVYGLPAKTLVECGYPLLDTMIREYNPNQSSEAKEKIILIAPSWGEDGIMDLCIEEMLDELKDAPYKVIVRPHPQYVRIKREKLDYLISKYSKKESIEIQDDFTSNKTVFDADILVTDWSGVAYEYAFTTLKPVLSIDTPMKVQNPEWQKIDVVPMCIWIRGKIGKTLKPDHMKEIRTTIDDMFRDKEEYREEILKYRNEYIYNLGTSAEVGAQYIIGALQKKIDARKGK